MARLRYNGLTATLNAALGSADTTITFGAPLQHSGGTQVPTITGGDVIPLSILDAGNNLREIVYLTAYTAGGLTGTITRGQEGTAATTHLVGFRVINAINVADLTGFEPTVTAGTAAQYWRGDKTWQTLNAAAVAGLGTAATKNTPASGDAAAGEVVLGADSRMTNSRTPTAHNHTAADVNAGVFSTARLGTGTADNTRWLRGDGTWQLIDKTTVGLPNVTNVAQASRTQGGDEGVTTPSTTTGTVTLDCSTGSIFTITPTGNITLAVTNPPATGHGCTITVVINQGATAYTVTMPTGNIWLQTAPTQAANKKCVINMLSTDGGTSWLSTAVVQP